MRYRRLGNTNLEVSAVSLGLMGMGDRSWRNWVLEYDECVDILDLAIESGINFFDTSNFYSLGESERLLGRYLADRGTREQVVIATKLGNRFSRQPNDGGYSRKHIIKAAEDSLRRLGTDHIDVYQTHIWDSVAVVDEVLEAFDHLRAQGKVLYTGFTNPPAGVVRRALALDRSVIWPLWHAVQVECNFLRQSACCELEAMIGRDNKGIIAYGPFARGYIPGHAQRTSRRSQEDEYIDQWYGGPADATRLEELKEFAKQVGVDEMAEAALAWVLARPFVSTVLLGVSGKEQLQRNLDTMERSLTDNDAATRNGSGR